jgi:hypothetical protein
VTFWSERTKVIQFERTRCVAQMVRRKLRIDAPRHIDVAVAEILGDLLHRNAVYRHADGGRVAQHVRRGLSDFGTKASGLNAALNRSHTLACPLDDERREGAALRLGECVT